MPDVASALATLDAARDDPQRLLKAIEDAEFLAAEAPGPVVQKYRGLAFIAEFIELKKK